MMRCRHRRHHLILFFTSIVVLAIIHPVCAIPSKLVVPTTATSSKRAHPAFLHRETTTKRKISLTSLPIHDIITTPNNEKYSSKPLSLRGGACDSDAVMFLKLFPSITLQAILLFLLLLAPSSYLSSIQTPQINNLPLLQYIAFFLVIFSSSLLGSLVDGTLSAATKQVLDPNVTPGEAGWYGGLKRPKWEPPGYIFAIMWLIVSKPTQFLAVSRLFRLLEKKTTLQWNISLFVYCIHLSLGDTWNKVFFGYQCIGRGVVVISIFWSVLVLSAALFYRLEGKAGLFMMPTCLWVSVASALNWNIYLNNKGE